MTRIFEYNLSVDFLKHVIWQYSTANKLNSLVSAKENWYLANHQEFWQNWVTQVLSIETATDFGLNIWGNWLQVPRTYEINGVMTTLDTEQYRLLLRGRLFLLRMRGSIPEINEYLKLIFSDSGRAYIQDNLDMTMNYVLEFNPTEEQTAVLLNTSVLPKPAGVRYKILVMPPSEIFGFNGSGFTGFNQAPFWDKNAITQGQTELGN